MLGQIRQEGHVEAVPRLHPLVEVLGLEVIAQEVLGEIGVLREVHAWPLRRASRVEEAMVNGTARE
jgi:hypothetical protein